jgi:CHAT domain-containing protein
VTARLLPLLGLGLLGLLVSESPSAWGAQAGFGPSAVPAAARAPGPATTAAADPAGFQRARYTPAILHISVTRGKLAGDDFIDLVLTPQQGELQGRRVPVNMERLGRQLRALYGQLARQDPIQVADPESPPRQLHRQLIEPVEPELRRLGVTTLLLVPDAGLQAVPFAALHDGERSFGERYAFAITPSVTLMQRDVRPQQAGGSQLALGASRFESLAPLPLVPQEVSRIAGPQARRYLDQAFTPEVLMREAGQSGTDWVHVATHAEFLPGGPSKARIYAGNGSLDLSRFGSLRQRRADDPLDLFVLSACRTALGDASSELGFSGLALQAGSRSAIGTLWYVDDVATSAFFVHFYRQLRRGLPKAEALQATRLAFASGQVRLEGERMVAGQEVLLNQLTPSQQRRVGGGLSHPFFWAGIQLLGTPW